MKYIEAKKPVVVCECGVCMQPSEGQVQMLTCYNPKTRMPTKTLGVKCPICGKINGVKYFGEGYFTNLYDGKVEEWI